MSYYFATHLHTIYTVATFIKTGNKWRAQVCVKGQRESGTFSTKTAAKLWAAEREAFLRDQNPLARAQMLHTIFDRYANEVSVKKRGERWERIRLEKFKREFDDMPVANLTPEIIAKWRDGKTIKPGSVIREMTLLQSVLTQCVKEWGLLRSSPLETVKRPEAPRPRTRLISDAEVLETVTALGWQEGMIPDSRRSEVAVLFLLACETAMRQGELLSLEWSQIDLDARVAHLDKTKNGDSRHVPLSTRAVELFRLLPADRPFHCTSAQADATFRKYRPKQFDFTFHDSRAYALTRMSKLVDVLTLARISGHRDPRNLMIYYRESAEDIAQRLG